MRCPKCNSPMTTTSKNEKEKENENENEKENDKNIYACPNCSHTTTVYSTTHIPRESETREWL